MLRLSRDTRRPFVFACHGLRKGSWKSEMSFLFAWMYCVFPLFQHTEKARYALRNPTFTILTGFLSGGVELCHLSEKFRIFLFLGLVLTLPVISCLTDWQRCALHAVHMYPRYSKKKLNKIFQKCIHLSKVSR